MPPQRLLIPAVKEEALTEAIVCWPVVRERGTIAEASRLIQVRRKMTVEETVGGLSCCSCLLMREKRPVLCV